jgi:glycosyltransferase involved in cell wall biosynthesis
LAKSNYTADFEVVIVEDGSTLKCDTVVTEYGSNSIYPITIKLIQGQVILEIGMKNAMGEYFIIFDSDCIIPSKL